MRIPINVKGKYLGLIDQLLTGHVNYEPLYAEMRIAAAETIPTDMEAIITVQAKESEINMVMEALSHGKLGVCKRAAESMRESLIPQIMAGIAQEGEDEELVLENGLPVPKPGSTPENPIYTTQPKFWHRLYNSLLQMDQREHSEEDDLITKGWKSLVA